MKIKLSLFTPREPEGTIITPKVRSHTLKEICLPLDVTHVMNISRFCPNKGNLKKKKENKIRHHAHAVEDENLPQRESEKKVILQVMKNMC